MVGVAAMLRARPCLWLGEPTGFLSPEHVALDAGALGDALQWEPSRGGALFPHLYRELRLADVLWREPLPLVSGQHVFPSLADRR